MKYLRWLFFIFIAIFFQTKLSIFNHHPNFVAVIVYVYGLKSISSQQKIYGASSLATMKSTMFGASIGIIEDIMSGAIIGPNFFSKGVIGFMSTIIFSDLAFQWTRFWGGMAMLTITFLDGLIIAGLRALFTDLNINAPVFFKGLTLQAVINIAFGIIVRPRE